MNRREIFQAGLGALSATALMPRGVLAQAKFPERPIKLVIPFSAGGVTDIVGRHWAERMKGPLGTVYVENQGGAAGSSASTDVSALARRRSHDPARQHQPMVLNPMTIAKLSYDPVKDFVPISICASPRSLSLVHASVPEKTLKEFVDYTKANPGKLRMGRPAPAR